MRSGRAFLFDVADHNASDMDDADFAVPNDDKRLTQAFLEG